jgi:uncharacterized protein
MDEILASIRRIIADDDSAKAQPPTPPKAAEPVTPPRPATLPSRMGPPPQPAVPETQELDSMLAQLHATSAQPPAPAGEPASDILELTEQMAAPDSAPAPGFRTINGQSGVVFEEPQPELAPRPAPRRAVEAPRPPMPEGGLISAATSAAVDSAFNSLAQTVLVENARTLEDLVREMLRPMLKTWLDDNLPGMVERLVRAEIERVSRGRA